MVGGKLTRGASRAAGGRKTGRSCDREGLISYELEEHATESGEDSVAGRLSVVRGDIKHEKIENALDVNLLAE